MVLLRPPQHLQHRMSVMTSKIVTITCREFSVNIREHDILTVVIAPTIVMITVAIEEMIALIPRPIAEKIDP